MQEINLKEDYVPSHTNGNMVKVHLSPTFLNNFRAKK